MRGSREKISRKVFFATHKFADGEITIRLVEILFTTEQREVIFREAGEILEDLVRDFVGEVGKSEVGLAAEMKQHRNRAREAAELVAIIVFFAFFAAAGDFFVGKGRNNLARRIKFRERGRKRTRRFFKAIFMESGKFIDNFAGGGGGVEDILNIE